MFVHPAIGRQRTIRLCIAVLLCLVLVGGIGVSGSSSALARQFDETSEPTGLEDVFSRIAESWEQGDQKALAELVHTDGVLVNSSGGKDRQTRYSPSQAFYYFKNLFQRSSTLSFHFHRMQDDAKAERVHGLAVWEFTAMGAGEVLQTRMLFVLTRHKQQWRIVEINTIR